VLVAALGGLALADRALRPVDRITRVAAGIGASDLHRRVGDALGGTGPPADELGRLVATFDGMLARLEEAAAGRQRLTADVAHELGTPIATIGSAAEIALRHPRSAVEYRTILQQVVDESRHMGRLVDDLLLLARADAGRLPMEREIVELDEVCRQGVRAYEALAREQAVALYACLPHGAVLVRGDEGRLGQVLRNLLDNALRHTPAGGTVTVALEMEQGDPPARQAGQVLLRVSDTGPGIVPGERERVFERFHRAQIQLLADGQRGSSGLGLAICRAIVDAHGGQIRVAEGNAESGATFIVTLPRLDAA
jgi:two-component system heavy metal sensor histidine kinase CusS